MLLLFLAEEKEIFQIIYLCQYKDLIIWGVLENKCAGQQTRCIQNQIEKCK